MFQSFEDLDVWKISCQLAVNVYEQLRASTDFGLKDQMQRSAVSIASNIAEGYERSDKEFTRFLAIARGSSSELRTQAYIANRVGTITDEARSYIVEETKRINRMLYSLAKSRLSSSPET